MSKRFVSGISSVVGIALLVAGLVIGVASTYTATTSLHGVTATTTIVSTTTITKVITSISQTHSTSSGMLSVSEGGTSSANATTRDYSVMLVLGPAANMISCGQTINASSTTQRMTTNMTMSGGSECMLEGQMTSMTSMSNNTFHLEAHVYDLSTGAALIIPINQISITIANASMRMSAPIAVMYDPTVGLQDIHYGNNVAMNPSNYTLTVGISDQSAIFNVQITMSSMTMTQSNSTMMMSSS